MPELLGRLQSALSDRYRLDREIGAGGMATVYLAEDVRHDRRVALKVLRPELAAVIGAERFLAEIKLTANLQHPHILPLFDSGEADSYLFYVMPFVEGETLRDRMNREKQLPVPDAVRIVERRRHLDRDLDRLADGQLPLVVHPVAQRLAGHERHDVEQVAVRLAGIEEREDMGVLEVGGELDLGQEALGPDHGRQLGPEDLKRHAPVVPDILGQVDRGHTPGADLPVKAVAVGQGGLEPAEELGHCVALCWGCWKMYRWDGLG